MRRGDMVFKRSLRPMAKVAFFALLLCSAAHAQIVASGSFSTDVLTRQNAARAYKLVESMRNAGRETSIVRFLLPR